MRIFREHNEKPSSLMPKYLCSVDNLMFETDSQEIKLCTRTVKDSTLTKISDNPVGIETKKNQKKKPTPPPTSKTNISIPWIF